MARRGRRATGHELEREAEGKSGPGEERIRELAKGYAADQRGAARAEMNVSSVSEATEVERLPLPDACLLGQAADSAILEHG